MFPREPCTVDKMSSIAASPGVYFVRLRGDDPMSVNDNDARRRDGCVKVNAANCKYGMSVNLHARYSAYSRTFGPERLQFDVLVVDEHPVLLEQLLHTHFATYRMRGKAGRTNEWLHGIDPDQAFEEAKKVCCNTTAVELELVPLLATVETATWSDPVSGRRFFPEDILRAAEYLYRIGMSPELLSELHHFRSQTYKQTFNYFAGKTRIQGQNNSIYAARLNFVAKGHMQGGHLRDLVEQAKVDFPFPDVDPGMG